MICKISKLKNWNSYGIINIIMITEVCNTVQTKFWSVIDVNTEQCKILPLGWGTII